ncbi:MAG: histidinol-phosphatase [Opitutales bacterium]
MKIDCHMHTPLCGHAFGAPGEYVRRAAETGIKLMTFTCHIPMDDEMFGGPGIRMPEDELPRYMDWIARTAEEAHKDFGIEVLTGIEAEIFPDPERLRRMDEILARENFDFVLGSLHHHLPAYRKWLKKNAVKERMDIIDTYFRHLSEGARSGRYHSIAHPDVIRIYGTVRSFDPREHEAIIREFLQVLVNENVYMEVNTSGLTKGVFQVHPDPVILEWAVEAGVKLTIGSDAHQPAAVGQKFEEVLPLLREKGFRSLHYFRKKEPHAVAI